MVLHTDAGIHEAVQHCEECVKAYPQIPFSPELRARVEALQKLSVQQLLLERRFEALGMRPPTLGHPAQNSDLESLRDRLEVIARMGGYPDKAPSRGSHACRLVDLEWSICLAEHLPVSPQQAFNSGMWNFITSALVPDLVKWRWGRDGGSLERWIGAGHGGRNCFGRLWRRAWTLKDDAPDPYWMVRLLVEDEFVQIFERTALAGCRPLAREVARTHLANLELMDRPRTECMRDLARQLLRIGAFVEFDALDPEALKTVVGMCARDLFRERSGLAG